MFRRDLEGTETIMATASSLRLGPELAGTLMTTEEFDTVEDYDECWRYELIHGILVVNPIAQDAEVAANEYLGVLLFLFQQQNPQSAARAEALPGRYIRSKDSRRLADRVIWAGLGRRPRPRRDLPTIAVEFVSAGKRNRRRDYEEKRKEYLEVGIVEYWLFDRFDRILTVFRRSRPQKKIVPEAENYRTPLLPGFELPVGQILEVADRWAEDETDGD
jgi:Uma2 family endonuclease